MTKLLTKEAMRKLVADLRAMAPSRSFSYGESLQVARVQAARLRGRLGTTDMPEFDLSWLIQQSFIPVNFVPSHELKEESGLTTNARGGKLQIFLHEREPDVRQRFSVLHEFKHALDFENFDVLYSRLGSGSADRHGQQIELICNEFAAQVLMPADLVKRLWLTLRDIESVALHFYVSPEAMRTRLTRLGFIDRPVRKQFLRRVGYIAPDSCTA
jgi:hypothetical protein